MLLGAGLDSRCYRLRDELSAAALFEVDHPVTAAVKAERLEAIFGEMPDHVNYVHVDFNTQDVGERLAAHGFDPAARSIVLWSGVAPYLEPEGVAQTLRWFASGTGPGSAMCFDYLWQEMLDGDDSFHGAPELRKRVEEGGEPFKFGIPRGGTKEFVEGFGLTLEEDLGPRTHTSGSSTTPASPTASAAWRSSGIPGADRGGRGSVSRAPSRHQRRRQEPREDERAPRGARGDGPRRRRDLHRQRQLRLPGAEAAARGAGEAARVGAEQAFGMELRLVLLTHAQLKRVVKEAPRGFGAETDRCDVIFLFAPLTVKRAVAAMETKEGVDRIWAGTGVVYFSRLDREGHEQPHGQGDRQARVQEHDDPELGHGDEAPALMEILG